MLLFFKQAITGERQFAANFIIFRTMPSNPVALEVSSEFMTEDTCTVVIIMQVILKYVLSGTLLLTYSMSFVRSNWFVVCSFICLCTLIAFIANNRNPYQTAPLSKFIVFVSMDKGA